MKPVILTDKYLMCSVSEEQWTEMILLAREMGVDLGYLTREAALLGVRTLKERNKNEQTLKNTVAA